MSEPRTHEIDTYSNYIVGREQTNAGEMDQRKCPLCSETVLDIPEKKPTAFLFHLNIDKPEHQELNSMCICTHNRASHHDSAERGLDMGSCAFSGSCGCRGFRANSK